VRVETRRERRMGFLDRLLGRGKKAVDTAEEKLHMHDHDHDHDHAHDHGDAATATPPAAPTAPETGAGPEGETGGTA
jgi:hypothetical protein